MMRKPMIHLIRLCSSLMTKTTAKIRSAKGAKQVKTRSITTTNPTGQSP